MCVIVLFLLCNSGYSDRAPPDDTNSEEEAQLQEAIQRSLADNETTPSPSAPPPSNIQDSVRAARLRRFGGMT